MKENLTRPSRMASLTVPIGMTFQVTHLHHCSAWVQRHIRNIISDNISVFLFRLLSDLVLASASKMLRGARRHFSKGSGHAVGLTKPG